jgi:hypothetical protein
VFFHLPGTAGYLSLSQSKSVAQVSRFFWTLRVVAIGPDRTITLAS